MLTSLGERGDARRLAEIGFAGYLTKPLQHRELFNILSAVLAGSASSLKGKPLVTRHSAREIQRFSLAPGGRVLLVEDNITNQQVAMGILKKFGLKADAAANGAEALRALESIPYDLVLMDVQMPVMDGLEATRSIRDPQSVVLDHNIPIIAMTAHALQSDRVRCLEAGMNDYVSKPVEPSLLADVLNRWLPGNTGHGETGNGEPSLNPNAAETKIVTPPDTLHEQAADNQPLVFDKAALTQRLMGDEELAQVVLAGFLEDIPLQIQALKDFLDRGDITGVERQAHTIKGASANIGAEALRALAFELEKSGKTGDLAGIQERMGDLEAEFGRLREVLQKEI
jgi:CheY-like chemotaxis protein